MNYFWLLLPIWFLGLAVCWVGWIAYLALRKRAHPNPWAQVLGVAALALAPVVAALANPHLVLIPTAMALLAALYFMGVGLAERVLSRTLHRGSAGPVKANDCTEAGVAAAGGPVTANGAPRTTAQPEQVRVLPGDEDFLTEAIASVMAFKSNSDVLEVHVRGLSLAELFRSEHAEFFYQNCAESGVLQGGDG